MNANEIMDAFQLFCRLGVRHVTVDKPGWERIRRFAEKMERGSLCRNLTAERNARLNIFTGGLMPEPERQPVTNIHIQGVHVECEP